MFYSIKRLTMFCFLGFMSFYFMYSWIMLDNVSKMNLMTKVPISQEMMREYARLENVQDEWKEVYKYQQIRLSHFYKTCKELGLNKPYQFYASNKDAPSETSNYEYNGEHVLKLQCLPSYKFAIKMHAKAGCSSLKTILHNNSDVPFNPDMKLHTDKVVRYYNLTKYNFQEHSKNQVDEMIRTYFNVIHVRHPLTRLESSFFDKFTVFGQDVSGRGKGWLKKNKNITHQYQDVANETFAFFLDNLFQAVYFDLHWIPYSEYRPCAIPYRYISKLETADLDMSYIIKKKLANRGAPVQANAHLSENKPTFSDRKLLKYFSNLTNSEQYLQRLMNTGFGVDMKLFGYDYEIEDGKVYATCLHENQQTGLCY